MVGRSWETGRQVLPPNRCINQPAENAASANRVGELARAFRLENWRQAYDNLGVSTLCEAWLALDSAPIEEGEDPQAGDIPRKTSSGGTGLSGPLALGWGPIVAGFIPVTCLPGSALLFRPAKICSAAPI